MMKRRAKRTMKPIWKKWNNRTAKMRKKRRRRKTKRKRIRNKLIQY